MSTELNSTYWSDRYHTGSTGWDLGQVSPPIKAYIDQLQNREFTILIPGCGNGHEGRYLWKSGFKHTYLLDFSPQPKLNLMESDPDAFPFSHWYIEDFFEHQGSYDLIIEQTLFCAIDPLKRKDYAIKVAELLKPGGKLVGLLFNREFESGPPFGGNQEEYESYFKPYFSHVSMSPCHNSIEPRMGSELFIQMQK